MVLEVSLAILEPGDEPAEASHAVGVRNGQGVALDSRQCTGERYTPIIAKARCKGINGPRSRPPQITTAGKKKGQNI